MTFSRRYTIGSRRWRAPGWVRVEYGVVRVKFAVTVLVHTSSEIHATKRSRLASNWALASRVPDWWGRAFKLVDHRDARVIWVYPLPWQIKALEQALTKAGFTIAPDLPVMST
jgi:hypothetical protein